MIEPEFYVYREGLVAASVCSSLPADEVARRMSEYPCGTNLTWVPDPSPTFVSGQPNPCTCDVAPETHTHYLFCC